MLCSILSRTKVGAWRSLVARCIWDAEVGGSIPLAPTISNLLLIPRLAVNLS
jgi:hypothetical protein